MRKFKGKLRKGIMKCVSVAVICSSMIVNCAYSVKADDFDDNELASGYMVEMMTIYESDAISSTTSKK